MSVLRYPGGKTRAVKGFKREIDERGYDTSTIISPFFGGGSFELHMRNKHGSKIVANDKFEPLANFWSCTKEHREELVKEVEKLKPLSKARFLEIRKELLDTKIDKITRAAYYFAVNRSSFSGSTCSGGFSKQAENKRFNGNAIGRLAKIDLDGVEVSCLDFVEFLEKQDDETFIYLDPPYNLVKQSKLYGNNGDLHDKFDHEGLRKVLDKKKNWMLCYNDCEYVRELYKEYEIVEVSWSYGMNKSKKSSEVLVFRKKNV